MPVILATLTFLYIGTTQIEIKTSLHQICRMELLHIQQTASKQIQTLLALNRIIDLIRTTHAIAIVLRALSLVVPGLIAISQFLYQSSQSLQKTVSRIQKIIIFSLRKTMMISPFSLTARLQKELTAYSKRTQQLVSLKEKIVHFLPPTDLSVEPVTPQSNLTKYRLRDRFEERQRLQIHWKYRMKTAPQLITWANWSQAFGGQCSATLKKENPWQPTLYVDRRFWSYL